MTSSWGDDLVGRHQDLKRRGLWRERKTLESPQSSNVVLDNAPLLNFSSNDYLGLANNESIKIAASDAVSEWGIGSGASHLVCGHSRPHHELEAQIAKFVNAEQALLFANGYMANLAIASAFLNKGDLILQDKLNHASLIDAGLSSKAVFKRYAHNDLTHAQILAKSVEYKRVMIASDAVFSMDGDIARLVDLYEFAEEIDALLLVDDAHGFGVLGDCGRGALDSVGIKPKGQVLMMGTLGKAVGSYGAFIAGDSLYIEQLIQSARSYIYTTALPPAMAAAASASLALMVSHEGLLQRRLQKNIDYFKAQSTLCDLVLMPSDTAIQPILIGDSSAANELSEKLIKHNILVPSIRPPTVSLGTARLRVALSASHTHGQIDELLGGLNAALKEVRNEQN
jgi:8-amino-7-oxononanoate synthase